jgi:hypothetical protein
VGAAVFRRGTRVWVVFDAVLPVAYADERKAELIPHMPHPAATIFLIPAPHGYNPTLSRVGSAWVVDFRDQPQLPQHPVTIEPRAEPHPRVQVGLRLPATTPIGVTDPALGERLLVVPNAELGQGVARGMQFVDFDILPTAQGLALAPATEELTIAATAAGVEIGARDGLVLGRVPRGPEKPARALDFAAWRVAPEAHLATRRRLAAAAAQAPEERRTEARLALARFFLAETLATEAHGVLDAIERDDPGVFLEPAPRVLRAAAAFLAGDRDAAAGLLAAKMLDGDGDAELWRGALAAASGDWPAAARGFAKSEPVLVSYPKKTRHKLLLLAAEAAVAANEREAARAHLEKVLADAPGDAERGAALMLVAQLHRRQGDVEKALTIWNEVAAGPDRLAQVRARLERVATLLELDRIPRPDAIRELEALHADWRGDEIEFATLRLLAVQRLKEGDWRGGFAAFRQLRKNFPDHLQGEAVATQAAEAVAELLDSPDFVEMPALRAFALFEQYREFLPAGAGGDAVAAKLTDRLAAVDLLEQAATVVEGQIANRATDAEKAPLTTRLAALRLRDGKAEVALAALAVPVGEVPAPLALERRLLEARAQSALGRTDAALALLGDDTARPVDQVRLDILSKAKDWKAATPVFARLAPAAGDALDDSGARHVLNWATSAALAGVDGALATIRERYAARLDKTPLRADFHLLVDEATSPGPLSAVR